MNYEIEMEWDGTTLSGNKNVVGLMVDYPPDDCAGWVILKRGERFFWVGRRRPTFRPNGRGILAYGGMANLPCAVVQGWTKAGDRVMFYLAYGLEAAREGKPWDVFEV